jgi:deazaflavin-dependent oxidoreductase (nitroreductase family)
VRRLLNALSPIPFPAWFMRLGGRLNVAWLHATRGRGPLSSDVVILTTRGRHSGHPRSTALLYFDRGRKRYVVASFAGLNRHPDWYLNAVADPHVIGEVQGKLTRCRAHVLDEDEAVELWPFLDQAYPGFRRYRKRTSRPIPIVELIPGEAGAESARGAA